MYLVQSTDQKPTNPPRTGFKLEEQDTGRTYFWDGTQWIFWEKSEEAKNKFTLNAKTSIHQLLGDTFAKTPLTRGYLLEDLNDDTGGNALTNTGSISLARVEDDLPLRGFPVPTLNGTDQYFSKATDADLEVGTNSFLAGIWFKTTTKATGMQLLCYGDVAVTKQNWRIAINSQNRILAEIDDGTNAKSVIDTDRQGRFQDGKWHIAMMFADKNTNTMYLLVGESTTNLVLVGSVDISSVTGTLNGTGEQLTIGARKNGTAIQERWSGQLSNFFLYDMAAGSEDYNLPSVLAAGIRESAFGSAGSLSLLSSTSRRLNNIFRLSNNNFAHTTGIIHTDEGFYDLLELYDTNLNRAISEISIDGIVHSITDRYSASAAYNVKKITRGIFLSEGSHIFKLRHNGKNASSSGFFSLTNMIELIKRDGTNEGGATSFTLFGDEIIERTNNSNITGAVQTSSIFNNIFGTHSTANANNKDFTEGDLYLKRGLWKITYTGVISSDFGQLDVDFGSVEVFDQLDLYKSTLQRNKQFTRFVRLDGGKTNIRLAINGKNSSSTDFRFELNSLRGELVSGNGMGDKVEIFGFDDFETVSGASPFSPSIATSHRFNGRALMVNTNLTEHLYRRYFSGGVYRVKFIHPSQNNLGILDVGLDANGATDIFNQLDQYSAVARGNAEAFTTIQIARGFHDIHFKTNGKNASSGGYYNMIQLLQFTLIARNGSTEDEDSENGNRVLLGEYVARKAESSATISLADVKDTKYKFIEIEIIGRVTAALEMRLQLSGLTTSYQNDYSRTTAGTRTEVTSSGIAHWVVFDATALANANDQFVWRGYYSIDKNINNGYFTGNAGLSVNFVVQGGLRINSQVSPITEVKIITSTSTWKEGTQLRVYGVKSP